jgi:hypothetical protein
VAIGIAIVLLAFAFFSFCVTVATMAFSISPGWTCRGCQAHRAGGGRPGVAWRA